MLTPFCLALSLAVATAEGEHAAKSAETSPDVAVVCPEPFREALAPWVEHRTRQGHRIAFLSNDGTPDAVRQRIAGLAKEGGLRFVVLVGDAEPTADRDIEVRNRSVPT